jgi:DNA-binding CsgD family transcriptional regulator/tetratricopeptide (TPR) repeat protein
LVTMRPSPRPVLLERVLAVHEPNSTRRLRIDRLDDVAVMALTAALIGAPPGAVLSERIAGAAGNPLYVIELMRALEEDGALRARGGVVEVDDRALPASLRDTIVRRLSALAADTLDALSMASLLGREFLLHDLATVVGRPVVEVASVLRAPVEMGVLSGVGDTLSFRHDLIREAVYDEIVPAIRRDLHSAAGRALAGAGAPVAKVAQQFALAARPGDVVAVEWLERAAIATTTLDLPAAVSLFERALALADIDWDGRTRLEVELLEALAGCGRINEARALGATLLERGVDNDQQFLVRRGLAVVSTIAGDIATAVDEHEAAAALPDAPEAEAAFLRCLAANMSLITGRSVAEVEPIAERALSEAQSMGATGAGLACVAHQTLAMAAGIEGRYQAAADHARSSRQLLSANAVPTLGFLIPDMWEAAFLVNRDRLDEAIRACARAAHRAERRGETSLLTQTHFVVGGVHFLAGRWEDSVSECEAAIAVAHETGNHAQLVGSHALLALVALGRGDVGGAEAALAASHRALHAGGHLFGVERLLWAQARLLEARNDPAGALALLTTAWEQTASLRGVLQYRNLGPDLVRLAKAANNCEQARSVATAMEQLAANASTQSATAAALRARGLADGDPHLLTEAVEQYRPTPRRPELASTCEDAGHVLSRHGQRDTAIALLDEAASIYLECGASADVARVDSVLRAHNVRRRRHGPAEATHGWTALSPTELKVVDLVAQGLSNPQIGATLYVSRRTVETHLGHVFRKLDVGSRAQLAAYAAARDH